MSSLTFAFLAAIGIRFLAEWWLGARQIRAVAASRDAVPAAFRGRITLEAHRRAAGYTLANTRFHRIDDAASAVLLLIWTIGGGVSWLNDVVSTVGLGPVASGTLLIVAALFIMSFLDVPFRAWHTFGIEARFGFNRTTPGLFVSDLIRQSLVALALGAPLVAAILWLMGAAGSTWWILAFVLWFGFTLALSWAYPAIIAPLFNRFAPLPEGPERERIEGLLRRTGFQSRGIFVMDGSRRSSHGNAYFTGLGKTKRIVFFDTLLKSLSLDETEAVLAHELGHYHHRHILKRLALGFAIGLTGFALLGWCASEPGFYSALGVREPSHATALLLFLLAVPPFTFFFSPAISMLSRRDEYEADRYAARHTGSEHLVSALVKLYEENAATLTPDPLHSLCYDSHPPPALRIQRLEWRPS